MFFTDETFLLLPSNINIGLSSSHSWSLYSTYK